MLPRAPPNTPSFRALGYGFLGFTIGESDINNKIQYIDETYPEVLGFFRLRVFRVHYKRK